jgi:microcystin degradation protein MlrC
MTIADAKAAEHAFEVGIGNEGEFSLGGAYEPRFQKATKVHAYVKSLHDGTYTPTGGSTAYLQQTGKTAVLQVGNIDIVVNTKMGASGDPKVYRAFGIEPAEYRLVMVKSANQYKELYRFFSTLYYPTDTPGSSTANLRSLPFEHLPRPFYPLDDIDTFDDTVLFAR